MNAATLSAAVFLVASSFGIAAEDGTSSRTRPSSNLTGRLLLTGSSTMAPLMTEIAKHFCTLHPGVEIEVQSGGSGRGIADAQASKADIGMVSRTLTDTEADLFAFTIARDGVAVMLHKDNPVQALSKQQVSDIFTGRTANWKDVGGRDAPIIVFAASTMGGSTELFLDYFKIQLADVRPNALVDPNPARIRAITENPNGIVYMSVGEAERGARVGAPIKLLPVGRVSATSRSIRSGNYPISRPLALVTKDLPKGLVKEFINFSLSSQVTEAIEKFDFIPYLD
ncbi:phosphate ABC transporter substrate-binding protein [Bradyrhizobium sp. 186]|uniref:phosphate ABC transporter substrate-binding protein n=1 Tax=Bradyrhizobium sp. 186 TaxID=2782654 RepID=UPI0020016378|nr:phosphate ABC transporter substrate-binding protein [Bradyrhizobium sp. 186]UPK35104.1 phosphate ABC transporter substrate-binding protein [Bradyrhizobium sp. 186]